MALIVSERVLWIYFEILGVYIRLMVSSVFSWEKCRKIRKNRPFFRAAMARLGKYRTGGYCRIIASKWKTARKTKICTIVIS